VICSPQLGHAYPQTQTYTCWYCAGRPIALSHRHNHSSFWVLVWLLWVWIRFYWYIK